MKHLEIQWPVQKNILNGKHIPFLQRRAIRHPLPYLLSLILLLVSVGVSGAVGASPVQTYFIPLPEQQTRTSLASIDNQNRVGTVMDSVISIAATGNGSVVYYDHWEDGYELDISNPTQSTTQIWGDGNTSNGNVSSVCAACSGDILNAGNVITLRNNVSLDRNIGTILFDGRDKMATSQAVSVSRAEWGVTPGTVLAGAVEVLSVAKYGTAYEMPVGQNLSSNQMFEYTALFVMAGSDNTNCTYKSTPFSLSAGQNYHVAGGVNAGDKLVCDKPVQAHLITGDVSSTYESRWFTLVPDAQWSSSYYAPVGTTVASDPADVWIYNPSDSATINVTVDTLNGSSSVSVGANSAVRVQMPLNSGAHLSTSGAPFFAIGTVDSDQTGSDNQTHDWGYSLVPERNLTPIAVVGWGPGSADGTKNGNPIWVMAAKATTVYVDYDGSNATCANTIDGKCYDVSFKLSALQSKTVYDPTGDKDQTGMRLFTVDSTLITAAWGQDPATAGPGNPYLDMGTTVPPFPSVQLTKDYALIVDQNNNGKVNPFDTVIYTLTLKNTGVVVASNVVVSDTFSADLTYVNNSTKVGGVSRADDLTGATRFPLDEGGLTVGTLAVDQEIAFTYQAVVGNVSVVTNRASANSDVFRLTVELDTTVDQGNLTACAVDFLTGLGGSSASFYQANGAIFVRLTDGDKNTTAGQDVIPVTVRNPTTDDRETISLTETNGGSGIFEGSLPSSATGGQNVEDGTLYAQIGQALSVSYTDPIYGDTCTDPTPPVIAAPSQTKVLYLSADGSGGPDQDLDRIDPVATGDSTTALSQIIGSGGGTGSITLAAAAAASNYGEVSTYSFSYNSGTTGSNRILMVGISYRNKDKETVSSVTYGGQTMTYVGDANNATDESPDGRVYIYRLLSPPTGSNTLKVNWNAKLSKGGVVGAVTYAGVDQTTPTGTFSGVDNAAESDSPTVDVASAPGELVFGVVSGRTRETYTVPSPGTSLWSSMPDRGETAGSAQSRAGAAGTVTLTWEGSDKPWAAGGVSLKPAASTGNTSTVFTQTLPMASNFDMPVGGLITVTTHISGSLGANGTKLITATLQNDGTTFATLSNPTYNSGTGTLVWSGALGSSTTVLAGKAVRLTVTSGVTNPFQIRYDSSTYPSKISLPTTTVISVDSLAVYDDSYANGGGNSISGGFNGQTVYVRATVSDPFGAADIISATLNLSSTTVTLTDTFVVASTSGSKTYEYPWSTPGSQGTYNINLIAHEGYESIRDSASTPLILSFLDLGTPGVIEFIDTSGNLVSSYDPTQEVCVQVADVDQNTLPGTIETINATVSVEGGASASHIFTETGPDTGVFRYCFGNPNTDPFSPGDNLDADYVDPDDPGDTSHDDAVIIAANPAISISKTRVSPSDGTALIGDLVEFRIQVSNPGDTNLTSYTVIDTFPSGSLAYDSASVTPSSITASTIKWNLTNLASGGQRAFSVFFRATASASPASNGVSATAIDQYSAAVGPANSSAPVTITNPAITVAKTRTSAATANLGDTVTFQILVTNTGNTQINHLPLTDSYPNSCLQFASATPTQTSAGGGSVGWNDIGDLAASGGNTTVTVNFTVVGPCAPATNTAIVDSASDVNGDPVPAAQDDATVTTIVAAPTVAISKQLVFPANGVADVGDTITYSVRITNTGVTAITNLVLTDTYASGFQSLANAQPAAPTSTSSGQAVWNPLIPGQPPLLAGQSMTLTLGFTATAETVSTTNFITATGKDNFGRSTAPVSSQAPVQIIYPANLSLTKRASSLTPNVGSQITFTLVVSNAGPNKASGVTVSETLPSGYTYVNSSASAGNYNGSSLWTLGTINANTTANLVITAIVNATGSYTNYAQIAASGQPDPNSIPGDNSTTQDDDDSVTPVPVPIADLMVTKVSTPSPVGVGGVLTYTVVVKNLGPSTAQAVTVTEGLPLTGITYLTDTVTAGSYNSGTNLWTIPSLAASSSATLTLVTRITASTTVTNVTSATSSTIDLTSTNNIYTNTTPVLPTVLTGIVYDAGTNVPLVGAQVVVTDSVGHTYAVTTVAGGWYTVTASLATPLAVGAVNVAGSYPDYSPSTEAGTIVPGTVNRVDVPLGTVNLIITKNDGLTAVNPGQIVTYTIGVNNIGTIAANNVVITDVMPAYLTYLQDSSGLTPDTVAPSTYVWNLTDPLAAGTGFTFTLSAQVAISLPYGTTNLANYVRVHTTSPERDVTNNERSDIDQVRAGVNLSLNKNNYVASSPVSNSVTITYVLHGLNSGNAIATGVMITDDLSSLVSYDTNSEDLTINGVSAVVDANIGPPLTFGLPDLIPGASYVLTFTATVTDSIPLDVTTIQNVATISSIQPDDNPDNNTDDASLPSQPGIDLYIKKTATPSASPTMPGDQILYTLEYGNEGNTTFVTGTPGYDLGSTDTITWSVGPLATGDTGTVTFTVQISDPVDAGALQITNTAVITTPAGDLNPDNNSDFTSTPLRAAPQLVIVKDDGVTSVAAGERITYTLTYSNTGNRGASDVVITDTLLANAALVSADPTPDSNPSSGVYVWNIDTLEVDGPHTITLVATVESDALGGSLAANRVIISDDGTNGNDPDLSDNTSTDSDVVVRPYVVLEKSVSGPAYVGGVITYTIAYTNMGNALAQGVVISDVIPANTSLIANSISGSGSEQDGIITWSLGDMAPSNGGTLRFSVIVLDGAGGADTITPSLSIESTTGSTTITSTTSLVSKPGCDFDGKCASLVGVWQDADPTGPEDWNSNPRLLVFDDSSWLTPLPGETESHWTDAANLSAEWVAINADPQKDPNYTFFRQAFCTPLNAVGLSASLYEANDDIGDIYLNGVYVGQKIGSGVGDSFSADGGIQSGINILAIRVLNNTHGGHPPLGLDHDGLLFNLNASYNSLQPFVAAPPVAFAGQSVIFAIDKQALGGRQPYSYTIDFGDSSSAVYQLGESFNHTYTDPGIYTATITARAQYGCTGADQLVVTVLAADANLLANRASIGYANAAGTTYAGEAGAGSPLMPDLAISKSDAPDPVVAGESLTYTLRVTNTSAVAHTVLITDVLPSAVNFVSASPGCGNNSGTVTCALGDLSDGATRTITVTVTIDPGASGQIINTVVVAADETDPVPDNNSASEPTTVVRFADMGISKSSAPNPHVAGEVITYTLVITSAGPSTLTAITVTDNLPADLTDISYSQSEGSYAPDSGAWTGISLAAGEQITLTITGVVSATQRGDLTNTATVDAPQSTDLNPENNSDPDVNPQAVGVVEGVVFEDSNGNGVQDGGELGLSNVDVVITDSQGITQTVTTDASGIYTGTNVPGGTATLDVDEKTLPSGYGQTAGSDPSDVAIIAGQTNDAGFDGYQRQADLSLTKRVNNETPNVGSQIIFTLVISNAGPHNATGVSISDILPSGYSAISNISDGGVSAGQTVAWTNQSITAGERITRTFQAVVATSGNYTNIAQVMEADQHDPDSTPGNDNGDQSEDDEDRVTPVPQWADISGTVFGDANGSQVQNGGEVGTNAGGLSVNLLDSDANVVATTQVNANGQYIFTGVTPNTNYALQLTTNAGTIGQPAPAVVLPSGWVTTGENSTGTPDGTPDSLLSVTVATASVTGQNFGIERLPDSDDKTSAAQVNLGRTISVAVPALSGTDPEDGSLGAGMTLIITSLAANGTLYYDGSPVTLNQVISNYDPAKLSVDPNDGDVTVIFTYAVKDAAGQVDPTPATVTMPFGTIDISGTVFDDANGSQVQNGGEVGTNTGSMNVNLLDSDNNVLATTPVDANGQYIFTGVAPNTNYALQLTAHAGTIGQSAPTVELPNEWVTTGENSNGTPDGAPNSLLSVTVATTSVTGQNFGIERLPDSDDKTSVAQVNPGGAISVAVPALSGTDPEDGDLGTGMTLTITSLATDGTLYYDGSPVTLNQVISNYDPAKLSVDPNDGDVIVSFTYAVQDGAGQVDPTPATVTMPFQPIVIAGGVYDDLNGNGTKDSGENGLSNVAVALSNGFTTTTDASGLYTFTLTVPGTYTITETNPNGYISTGDTQGTNDDKIQVTVSIGQSSSNNNFLDHQVATVFGHIFEDTNGNGTQDSGEPNLPGVSVVITDSLGVTQTLTTDASGNYTATVPAGDTTADVDEATLPTGVTQTVGTDPTTVNVPPGSTTDAGNDGYQPPTRPTAVPDQDLNNTPGTPVTLDVLDNDTPGATPLDPTTVALDPTSVPGGVGSDTDDDGDIDQVVVAGEGTWTVDPATGEITFTPEAEFTGNPTPIDYVVKDTNGLSSNPATVTITYQGAPVLTAKKADQIVVDADSNGLPSPGDTISYTTVITNTGNGAATGVVFSDTPDANTALVVGSVQTSAGTVTTGNGAGDTTISVAIGTIPGDSQVIITFQVLIANPLPAGVLAISNQGTLTSNELPALPTDDPSTATMDDPTLTSVVAAPMLEADKRDGLFIDVGGDGAVSPGDTLLYETVIRNQGNAAASDVVFVDVPDPNTTLVIGSVQSSQGAVVLGNGAGDAGVRVNIGTIPGGTQAVVTFQVTINDPLPANVSLVVNQGAVTSSELPALATNDPETAAVDDPTTTPVSAAPQLAMTKQDSLFTDVDGNGLPSPGDVLQYRLVMGNVGNEAALNVNVQDTPDPFTRLVVGSVQTSVGTVTSGNAAGDSAVAVAVGTLPGDGSQAVITYRVIIVDPLPATVEQVANQALASADNAGGVASDDPDTPAKGDSTLTSLVAEPLLDVTKRDILLVDVNGDGLAGPGDALLYQIAILNVGNRAAANLIFTDTPDPNTALMAGSVQTNRGAVVTGNTAGDTTVRVNLGTLPGGARANVSFQVRITDSLPAGVQQVTNQGTVVGDNVDPAVTDDPDTITDNDSTRTPVVGAPIIGATKRDSLLIDADGNGAVTAGDTLLYQVVINNSGNQAAAGVFYVDTPDVNTTLVVGSVHTSIGTVTTGNTAGDSTIRVDVGELPARYEARVSYRVTINNPVPAGVTQVRNQGTVSGLAIADTTTDDPDSPDSDDPTGTGLGEARIGLAKQAQPPTGTSVMPGDRITYTLRLANLGTIPVTNVTITDSVPLGTDYIAGSATPAPTSGPDPLVWQTAHLAVGEAITVSFSVEVLPFGSAIAIVNAATAKADQTPAITSPAVILPFHPADIDLLSFTATAEGTALRVVWLTGAEIDTWGFHLWRSSNSDRAQAVRVTTQLIPAEGHNGGGSAYRFVDTGVKLGVRYWYWLEEVETNGSRNEYGPVSGTVPSVDSGVEGSHALFLPLVGQESEAATPLQEEPPTQEVPAEGNGNEKILLPLVNR